MGTMKIRNKILALVLAVCFFSVLSLSMTLFIMERRITDYSRGVNVLLIGSATDSAEYALIGQAHDFLQTIAREQADRFNIMFESFKFNILLMEGVLQDIFNNRNAFPYSRPVVRPSEIPPGTWANAYTLAEHIPMTDSIRHELNLLSNMNLLIPMLTYANPHLLQLYVGMESGLFYNYTTITFENPHFDPRVRPWYIAAVENPGKVIFTEVYEDAFGSGLVISAAKTVFDANGELLGVAAIDILLEHLIELISDKRITDSAYIFILNSYGKYIIHSDMARYGFDVFQATARHAPGLAEGYSRMMRGEAGIYEGELAGERVFLIFSPIPVTDWSVGFIIHKDELLSPLNRLMLQVSDFAVEADARIAVMSNSVRFILGLIIVAILIMVILLALRLTKIISEPIAYEKAALEGTSRMKTEYLVNISHETKTPLTVISVNVQLAAMLYAKSGRGDPEITESLNRAQAEIMRVSQMNDNTLRLASMQTGDTNLAQLDTSPLLKNSTEAYRRFIEKKKNVLAVHIQENLPALSGNADRLIQVMANLLTNANRHTENGLISVCSVFEDGFVKVTVKDSGTGIAPELLQKVFERGFSNSGGTGFGLDICKNTIESHGGKIWIESPVAWTDSEQPAKLGIGTAVMFLIPVHKEEQ